MYFNVRFYEKGSELYEIPFPVRLRGLQGVNTHDENSNIIDHNEIKIILLMFRGKQDLFLGMYTDLIFGKREKYWITYFKCKLIW